MQLALETSTNICSVAFKDALEEVYEKRTKVRGSHSEQLFLFIKALMNEHDFTLDDLESVIVSEGPGSYTGLRISASAIKGLLFQSKVPLFAANTLASFAVAAIDKNPGLKIIHSIIDARRVHVYHQQFDFDSEKISTNDTVEVIPIERFEKLVKSGDAVVGTGLKRIDEAILSKAEVFDSAFISARSLIKLFETDSESRFIYEVDPQKFEPKYYTSM